MKNFINSTNKFLLWNLLLLIKLSASIIIFPFKTINEEKNINNNQDDITYNYENFINDYFNKLIYINMSRDNAPKDVKVLITYQENGFKMRNKSECINNNKIEEINIKVFNDINLKSKLNCDNINYNMIISKFSTDINFDNYKSLICGIIGFRIDKWEELYEAKNDITKNFYSKGYTNENTWLLKYISNENGFLIFGTDNLKEIIPNYNSENLYKIKAFINRGNYNWGFELQKVVSINKTKDKDNNTYIINKETIKAEINNDFSLIQGNYKYYIFIESNFFNKYIEKKICNKNYFDKEEYKRYIIFDCDKSLFNEKDLKDFPVLIFYDFNDNVKFKFDYKYLFTETKYKFFFNVIFSVYNEDNWVFGKIFLKKYLIIINPEDKLIKVYIDKNINNNTINNIDDNKNKEEKNNNNNTLKQIIFIVIFILFGFLCFYFGRKLRRERKQKANELIDEYEYNLKYNEIKEENKVINYNNY